MTQEIYKFIKEKYKHCYALKNICWNRETNNWLFFDNFSITKIQIK